MYCIEKRYLELKSHEYTDERPNCISGYLYNEKYYTKYQLQELRKTELKKQTKQFETEMEIYQLEKAKDPDYKIVYSDSNFIS